MDFKSDIEYAMSKLKIEFSFSDYQLKALKSLYDLKDTIAVLPTGSGKSIIFQVVRCFRDLFHCSASATPPAEWYPACVVQVTGPCCMMWSQWDGRRCLMG
ncbi:hypothetical protein DPMN_055837 [Dreissena polymorpha]|uniref:DEAD/DEAH box helicase domain-containing protein n=1 Tax=Dreissena polymorpha TaxID=45954 RepID=A0A9D4CQN5_DREPO|nr:hypothetical protein DPMN_055837 [Dreissena polymorpha]